MSHFRSFFVVLAQIHKTKRKAADKTLEQRFLKEFKAICKNSSESELKQQKDSDLKCNNGRLANKPFNLSVQFVKSLVLAAPFAREHL